MITQTFFNHTVDLEWEYFVTFFHKPSLFDTYYVKEAIFTKEIIGIMMKVIETMYHDKKAITLTTLFETIDKDKHDIDYNLLKSVVSSKTPLKENTIIDAIQVIKVNTARRQLFGIVHKAAFEAKSPKIDVGGFIIDLIEELDAINITTSKGDKFTDVLDRIINQTKSVAIGESKTYFKVGVKEIDKKMPIIQDNIVLVGGPAKHLKSRFVMWIIEKLYENNPDTFATMWYSFEENSDEVVRKFIAYDTMLSDEEITGRTDKKLTGKQVQMIVNSANKIRNRDIEIRDTPKSIKEIQNEFQIYCKKHSNKVPIMIIDNALLIDNDEMNRDDIIMNTLNHIKQRTKALIFIVHHFNDAQQDEKREKDAFRPKLTDLKGREAYRRVPKAVLLINFPYKYPKIRNKHKANADVLKYMFIVDLAAIRYMGEKEIDGASNENNLIHMFAHGGFNKFFCLSDLHKNNKELRQLKQFNNQNN